MGYDHLRPRTLKGLKQLAKTIKKQDGITHAKALDAAARQVGFSSYSHARAELPENGQAPDVDEENEK